MKTLNIYAALFISIFAINFSFAQSSVKNETIKVWGNCGMCQKVIEKAALSAGASSANWNEDSKKLKLTYDESQTNITKIQEAIAKSGYDTQDFTADSVAYNKLPSCCHYYRKVVTTDNAVKEKSFTCPMHPEIISTSKGKCPKCGMNLVEVKPQTKKD